MPNHHKAYGNGAVYEHIIVAEQTLGRELNGEEVVHHKDMNKKNNSPDNLMVFKTDADHIAFHKGCDVAMDGDVWISLENKKTVCPVCGDKKSYAAKVCKRCASSNKMPQKDELMNALKIGNFAEIGRMYGVTDNAVRKWCKKYGLPYHTFYYKHRREEKEKKPIVFHLVNQIDMNTGETIATLSRVMKQSV